MKATEMFYTPTEAGLLLKLHPKTVIKKLLAGEFGRDERVLDLAKTPGRAEQKTHDYRIAASALNEWLSERRVFTEPGTPARTEGELRRVLQRRD